jgi:RimJ/RimL family protein N-acetyltransferase
MTLAFARHPDEADGYAEWVAEQIPHVERFQPPYRSALIFDSGHRVIAGVVFHDWIPAAGTIQLSMAAISPKWATRDTLAGLFRYAFETNGANKLWTATPHKSDRAIRFNRGIGMKQEAVLRHQFGPGVHAVVCSMLAAEWRASRWCDQAKEAA